MLRGKTVLGTTPLSVGGRILYFIHADTLIGCGEDGHVTLVGGWTNGRPPHESSIASTSSKPNRLEGPHVVLCLEPE